VKLLTQLEAAFKNWKNHKLCIYINREDAVELLKFHGIELVNNALAVCPDCKGTGAHCKHKECSFVCDTCQGDGKIKAVA